MAWVSFITVSDGVGSQTSTLLECRLHFALAGPTVHMPPPSDRFYSAVGLGIEPAIPSISLLVIRLRERRSSRAIEFERAGTGQHRPPLAVSWFRADVVYASVGQWY
jgi:hypothetical protein